MKHHGGLWVPSATRLGGRPPVVWRAAFAGMTAWVLAASLYGAVVPGPDDQKIDGLLTRIDRSSEKGEFDAVQKLRATLAEYAAGINRYDVAVRQYDLLLAARPGRTERVRLFTQLGKMRMALGDYGRAIVSFEDALHDSPKDWQANLSLARAFAATDLNARAIESYQRCIRLRPHEEAAYEELGQVYEKQGFLGKALTTYQQALAREPKPEIYLHMADCYVHLKNISQAIAVLTQAKARLPRAEYDVRLGEIYQKWGDMARAGAAWEEALSADATRDDVRLKLMLIDDSLHRRPEADRLFNQLVASYPRSPLVHYLRALVLLERGEKTAAQKEALVVEQLSPTEGVAHYNELLLAKLREPL